MQNPSFPRHPLCPIPKGPTPCPRGDPPNPICQLERERKCLCRPLSVSPAKMQPADHMSMDVEYSLAPKRTSGGRYHSVTTWRRPHPWRPPILRGLGGGGSEKRGKCFGSWRRSGEMLTGDALLHSHVPPPSSPQLSNSERGSQRLEPTRNRPISAPHSEGDGRYRKGAFQ